MSVCLHKGRETTSLKIGELLTCGLFEGGGGTTVVLRCIQGLLEYLRLFGVCRAPLQVEIVACLAHRSRGDGGLQGRACSISTRVHGILSTASGMIIMGPPFHLFLNVYIK
ncbi:unnamed protein product [Ectocarpus sp. 12 AP-2014]